MITTTVVALLALPLLVLRRRTLAAYLAVDLTTWFFAWLFWRRFPGAIDPYLAGVGLAVLKTATFSLFLGLGREVRWSANRAAIVAGIVYAVVIPTNLRIAVIDGDEPFYLLVTESLVRDRDLDLANQYRTLDRSETGRKDLVPQLGDPVGPGGEQYSRHEPFLPVLLIPGYLAGGLYGAIATIAIFGTLLVRSTVRWMEDEGVSEAAARAVFPFFAFAPPVLFYATRIWPEVPAAFFFVEALRGARDHRLKRWLPALLGLVLLKLRFVLVAIGVLATMVWRRVVRSPLSVQGASTPGHNSTPNGQRTTDNRFLLIAVAILVLPLLVMALLTGSPTSVHTWRELLPGEPRRYAIGFFGLLADGMSGIAFRAPFYLLGLFALTQWKSTPRGFRAGILASLLYILYLLPRMEWFGGWAPPLRYLVFLMPVLALGAASVWDRVSRGAIALIAVWTAGLVIHAIAFPWRLFHISNGENPIGEWLSSAYGTNFSRLFPSFIRENGASWIGALVVVLVVIVGVRRWKLDLAIPLASLALATGFAEGKRATSHVEFEDAHIRHRGGELYPELYQVARVAYRGGWVLEAGEELSFVAEPGTWRLEAITGLGATFELGGHAYTLRPDERYQTLLVTVPGGPPVILRCLSGAVNLDRMELVGAAHE